MPFLMGSGRKASDEWAEVVRVEGSKKVLCRHCMKDLTARIERIRAHLVKCCKRNDAYCSVASDVLESEPADPVIGSAVGATSCEPVAVTPTDCCPSSSLSSLCVAVMPQLTASSSQSSWSGNCGTPDHGDAASLVKKVKVETSQSVEPNSIGQPTFFSQVPLAQTVDEHKKIELHVAKFFYRNGIPFRAAKSKAYLEMMNALRPGFCPPTEHHLTGPLLFEAHKEIEQKIHKEVRNSTVTLQQVAWPLLSSKASIATGVFTGSRAFLSSTVECAGGQMQTIEFGIDVATNAIKEVQDKYNKEIFALCMDDVKMKPMRPLINERYPRVLIFGCSVKILSRLETAIPMVRILKEIFEDRKYDRRSVQPERNCCMPVEPMGNCAEDNIISTFKTNFDKYTECSELDDKTIQTILNDGVFFPQAPHLQLQLKEFIVAFDKLRSSRCTLSNAVEVWQDLLLSTNLLVYRDVIENQMNVALEPFFYVANLMDPLSMGSRLTEHQEKLAECWILTYKPEFFPAVLAFRIRDAALFPESMFEDSVLSFYKNSISKWWLVMESRSAKRRSLPPGFCNFFAQLFSCSPSSTATKTVLLSMDRILPTLPTTFGSRDVSKFLEIHGVLAVTEEDSLDSDAA